MFEKLRSRLKKNPRVTELRLSLAEKFLPADYYVQLRPPYATRTWEADRRHYDEKHTTGTIFVTAIAFCRPT